MKHDEGKFQVHEIYLVVAVRVYNKRWVGGTYKFYHAKNPNVD